MSKKTRWMNRKKLLRRLGKMIDQLNHARNCEVSKAIRKSKQAERQDVIETAFQAHCTCGCRAADYALLAAYQAIADGER